MSKSACRIKTPKNALNYKQITIKVNDSIFYRFSQQNISTVAECCNSNKQDTGSIFKNLLN